MAAASTPTLLQPLSSPGEAPPGLHNWSPTPNNNHAADADDGGFSDDDTTRERERRGIDPEALRREHRRKARRMYGGARHQHSSLLLHSPAAPHDTFDLDDDPLAAADDSSFNLLVGEEEEQDGSGGAGEHLHLSSSSELAGLVLAANLSPFPLLAPYACAQLSAGLFVPLLALAAGLGWLAATVVSIQGRYVGARSYPALASGVFPHRFKLHKLGEFLASLFVLGGSLVRTILGIVASAEVAVDLLVPERRRRDWEREVAVGVVGAVWVSVFELGRVKGWHVCECVLTLLDAQLLVPLLLSPILSLLGFRTPSSSSSRSHYTRLSTRSYSDLAASTSPSSRSESPSSPTTSSSSSREGRTGQPSPPPPPRWSALLRLPAWSVAVIVWPLALLILGVRLKRLNADSLTSPSPSALLLRLPLILRPEEIASRLEETQLWPAILLTFGMCLGASHETFYYVTALRRGGAGALENGGSFLDGRGRGAEEMGMGEGAPLRVGLLSAEGPTDLNASGGFAGSGSGSGSREKVEREGARRNQFPVAMGMGMAGAFLVHLGWALVGTVGMADTLPPTVVALAPALETRIPTGNLLSDPRLPRADPYLVAVRCLVLFATLTQIEAHAHVGLARMRRFLSFLRPVPNPTPSRSFSSNAPPPPRLGMRRLIARTGFYLLAVVGAWLTVGVPMWQRERNGGRKEVGGHGTGLVEVAEWSGVWVAGIGGCLVPALAYLVLFHLRRPRLILLSDPDAPQFSRDDLLQRKEREMQRRLSGRRIGTDLGVFGLLGPVGVVLVGRGLVALVRRAQEGAG
ncbi:hypothetical protein JCM10908_004511 [Rhodotorula pacifica]|uniref:uncharacterized protein n=1 Tax=Rhodotorula pacifica TaxID=1495444 RepID=UPI003170C398